MFDSFIGIPYLDKGRDFAGCDCWGLLCLVYRELRKVELPSYSDQYVTASDKVALAKLIAGEMGPWREIEVGKEQKFDAVLMREGRFPRHVGIVVTANRLLHVSQRGASRIERYDGAALQSRVVGFYRYQPSGT